MKTLMMYLALLAVLGCAHPRPAQVPGSTNRSVASVTIRPEKGTKSSFDWTVLIGKLGHRTGNVAIPPRYFNPYRLGEDRRRIATYGNNYGYFDIEVSEPEVRDLGAEVAIDWRVRMGERYRIGELHVVGVPEEARSSVMELIPFRAGGEVTVNENRILRHVLADAVRTFGYGHARVYSRAWVDRKKKSVSWYYFVDPGPKTRVGSISVVGNHRLAEKWIVERSGLVVGAPYSPVERDRAQLALMDGGNLVSVVVNANEDVHKGPPQVPDSGGLPITDERGELVKRELAEELDVTISVVEAPRRTLRVEVAMEADASRTDAYAGSRAVFRDLGTVGLHAVLDGQIGYGYELGTSNEPLGTYGYALAQLVRAGLLGTHTDVRLSAQLSHRLFPDTAMREYSVGPGLRRTLMDGLQLDVEALAFAAEEVTDLGLDPMARESVGLAADSSSSGLSLRAALVHDTRDSGVEAMKGRFASLQAEYVPGLGGSGHRWLRLRGDARYFRPVAQFWSLAARVSGGVTMAANDSGLPFQSRLFGGGSYGFRGYGRQQFATQVDGVYVGGTRLVESSLELRFLPFQQLHGLVGFMDVGAVSSQNSPVADGVSSVVGIGLRARPFYIPIALDVSYRYLTESALEGPLAWDPWSVFLRLGEAF